MIDEADGCVFLGLNSEKYVKKHDFKKKMLKNVIYDSFFFLIFQIYIFNCTLKEKS